jgi:outer membrane murein-binding lipoprotein Lpp
MFPKERQASTNKAITQIPMAAPQTNSKGANVPDIQSLSLKVEELSGSVDLWNNAIIISLVFAAFAAVAVGVSTYIAFKQASHLAKAQQELSEAKDSQLQIDLKNKDVEIETAKEEAAKANLELAKLRTPRTISLQGQSEIIGALQPFSGTPYDLSVASDSESADLMKIIQTLLHVAGWKQISAKGPIGLSNSDPLIGITVNTGVHVEIDRGKYSAWGAAIEKLVGVLKAKNIATQGNAADTGVEPNCVHIFIGKKP